MRYRCEARIDENIPPECLPHIGEIVDVPIVHTEGCRCTFTAMPEPMRAAILFYTRSKDRLPNDRTGWTLWITESFAGDPTTDTVYTCPLYARDIANNPVMLRAWALQRAQDHGCHVLLIGKPPYLCQYGKYRRKCGKYRRRHQ